MIQPPTPLQVVMLSLLLILANPAAAIEEVYKWVDTEGATHYGQTPPEIQPARIETVTLAAHNPDTSAQPDIQATLDVAKQLEISRLQRERFRLEKKKAQTEKLKAQQTAYNDSTRYYGGYGYGYYRPNHGRPHKPHHPSRPHKPYPSHHQSASSHRPSGTHNAGGYSGSHGGGAATSPH